jgi:hypothetical protein
VDEPLPIALDRWRDRGHGPAENLVRHTRHSYVGAMTTSAIAAMQPDASPDAELDAGTGSDVRRLSSVANPRRTTWTGFAKGDVDRLPAS